MRRPSVEKLTEQLLQFLKDEKIVANPNFAEQLYKSGVYSVLDCVFSSMAKFDVVVVPAITRFKEKSHLQDGPGLTFSKYIDYVRGDSSKPLEKRFEEVAENDFKLSQKISGRLKVEVAYDVCQRFADRGLETLGDVQKLREGLYKGIPFTCEYPGTASELEKFVIGGIAGIPLYVSPNLKVKGIGLALGAYLLILLGDETFVKPDTLLLRLMGQIGAPIGEWSPKASDMKDFQLIRQVISCAADKLNEVAQENVGNTTTQKKVTPASLDNALWAYEAKRPATRKKVASA